MLVLLFNRVRFECVVLLLHAGGQLLVQVVVGAGVLQLVGDHVELTPKLKHKTGK